MAGALSIIKVASLNCQGLNEYYKRMALFDYLKCSDLAVIFLQETKLKPENERKYMNEWHNGKCIFNSVVGGKSGTAILINHRGVEIAGPSYIDVEGRVIAIDIVYFGCKFHVVNSYGPNSRVLQAPRPGQKQLNFFFLPWIPSKTTQKKFEANRLTFTYSTGPPSFWVSPVIVKYMEFYI